MNAPKFKWNYSIKWDSPIGGVAINVRHVDQFQWNDGHSEGIYSYAYFREICPCADCQKSNSTG